jgi:hypothetical protein
MMLSLLPFLVERRMRLTPGRCAGLLADGGVGHVLPLLPASAACAGAVRVRAVIHGRLLQWSLYQWKALAGSRP